jgi:hypothetical protein
MSKRGVLPALVTAAMVAAWSPTVLAGPADLLPDWRQLIEDLDDQDGDHVVGEELCARPA